MLGSNRACLQRITDDARNFTAGMANLCFGNLELGPGMFFNVLAAVIYLGYAIKQPVSWILVSFICHVS